MWLAKIINDRTPIVNEVCNFEWDFDYIEGRKIVVKRLRRPWARKTKDGAAALSYTPAGAIASARVVLEQLREKA